MNRNLVLIGFMGAGKSTVGRACARDLGFAFRDSDAAIEQRAGKPISDIFADDGEAAFRELETATVHSLARRSRTVLATGGGVVLDPTNVAALRETGVVILLWADTETVLARTSRRSTRPLLAGSAGPRARIESLLAQREPLYSAAADAVVDTTGLPRREVVDRVLAVYRRVSCERSPPKPETVG